MPFVTRSSRIERAATLIIALLVGAVPLLHSGALADPFELPKKTAILSAALVLLALALLSRFADGETSCRWSVADLLAGLVAVSAGTALLTAPNRGLALISFVDLLASLVVARAVARYVRQPSSVKLILGAALAGAALVAIGTIAQVFVPGFFWAPGGISILPPSKAGASLGEAGLAVQFLVIALPAGVGALALWSGRLRAAWAGCLGLVLLALVFAGRPEGWAVGAMILVVLVVSRFLQVARSDREWTRLVPELGGDGVRSIVIAAIVALLILAIGRFPNLLPGGAPASPLDGVALLSPTTGDPVVDRRAGERGSLALLRLHPQGVGPGNWRIAFLEVAWTHLDKSPFSLNHQPWHAGSNFLERAAELGVAGGACLVLLVLVLLLQAWSAATRAPSPWNIAGLIGFNVVLATAIAAFYGEPFEEPAAALLFWITAGLVQVAASQARAGTGRLSGLVAIHERPPRRAGRTVNLVLVLLFAGAAAFAGSLGAGRLKASGQIREGMAQYYAGRHEAAVQVFRQAAVQASPDHLPRMEAGSSYLHLGFNELAAREFGEALRRSPWFPAAHLGRASAYQSLGRYDLAEEDLRAALAIWPDNSETRLALAHLNAVRGKIDAAIEEYTEIARRNPALAEPYFQMGQLYLRRGQADEAIESFRACGMKNPRYPKLANAVGDAFFKKGLLEMALRAYQGGAANDEKDADLRLKIANTEHALGQFCDAQSALEAARDLEADATRRASILDLIRKVEPDCRKQNKGGNRPKR